MIKDWRKKNNNENLPFFFVQLPIWKALSDNDESASWAILREQQKETLCLPNTGMAATLELGEWDDIHPLNKKDVGYRLFLAAEKKLFGIENTSPGPIFREQKIDKNEQKLYLYFDNCGDGLVSQHEDSNKNTGSCGSWLKPYISVIGDEGQFRLPAEIESKDCISIDISSVKNPQKILYAWADNPRDRQLFNSEGLPMLPFKIEIL
jgi:sialate O-acetylesterase